MPFRHLVILILGAAVLVACQPDTSCRQDTDVRAGLVLRCLHIDTLDVAKEEVSWDTITVQGVGSDSILYNRKVNQKQLYLPLQEDKTETSFILEWKGKKEILHIQHSNTSRFLSMACGCVIYHQIEKVWCDKVWADSVVIINTAVETIRQDNIRIYATVRDEKVTP